MLDPNQTSNPAFGRKGAPDPASQGEPAPVLDMRSARRASLMIRSAKLICQSGEYPCIVRDVSSGGVRLRLFHAMPSETYVLLELANGDTYAMSRVWNRELEAGFRFLNPIDVDAFIEESHQFQRRPIRLRLRRNGTAWVEGKPVEIALRNISQGGAGIDAATEFAKHLPVRLSVPCMPDCYARVAWRRGLAHGLVFERCLRLDELARVALDLQPLLAEPASQQIPLMFDDLPGRVRRANA